VSHRGDEGVGGKAGIDARVFPEEEDSDEGLGTDDSRLRLSGEEVEVGLSGGEIPPAERLGWGCK